MLFSNIKILIWFANYVSLSFPGILKFFIFSFETFYMLLQQQYFLCDIKLNAA